MFISDCSDIFPIAYGFQIKVLHGVSETEKLHKFCSSWHTGNDKKREMLKNVVKYILRRE